MIDILFLNPPIVRPSEPPGGIARLMGALKNHNLSCDVLDLNMLGVLRLIKYPMDVLPSDTRTKRAEKNRHRSLALLQSRAGYENFDRYKKALVDIHYLLGLRSKALGGKVSWTDYTHDRLSPLRSEDLIYLLNKPEDDIFHDYNIEEIRKKIDQTKPEWVGISINYLSQALSGTALIGYLRRDFPGIKIVVGGGLLTSWEGRPEWNNPFEGWVDEIVTGPGEVPLLRLLGISEADIAEKGIGIPDFSRFPLDSYISPGPVLSYSASFGCAWGKCAFCSERTEGKVYKQVPKEKVSSDLAFLAQHYKPAALHLIDNEISPALMRTLMTDPPGIDWYGFARFTRHLEDPEFCRALKESGCLMLQLGLESGDPQVLEGMRKGISLEGVSRSLVNLKKAGIKTFIYLLFGTPWEEYRQALNTLDFTVKHAGYIDYVHMSVFNLPKGCDEAAKLDTAAFFEGDLSLYSDFVHPAGWGRAEVRRFLSGEFKKHPVIRPIVLRTPPYFDANHGVFFDNPQGSLKF